MPLSINLICIYDINMQIRTLSLSVKLKIGELEKLESTYAPFFNPYGLPCILVSPIVEESRLAYYDSSVDAIVFQEDFIMNAGAFEERNVLLHELAHALEWKNDGYTDHGKGFRNWCRILGCDPDFSKANLHATLRKEESYARKVEKLLALASSPYEEESRSALMKAEKLMAEHGLRYAFEKRDEDKLYYVVLGEKGRFMQSEKQLFSLVRMLTGSFLIFESQPSSGRRRATLYGTLEQMETAIYLYTYLDDELESSLKRARRTSSGPFSNESYRIGLIWGLMDRIKGEDASASRALALSTEKSQKLYQQLSGQHVSMRRNRTTLNSLSDYRRGMERSRNISIPRKNGSMNGQKQIGHR